MYQEGIDDCIAAISTAMGIGGIGIVRMSGQGSIELADKVFKSKTGCKLAEQKSHSIHLGKIIDPEKTMVIDEVLVSIMRAPRSYTTEDVIEINCHGGLLAVKETLALLLRQGARLASPGEFTKRAFLNGRLDLAQSEAVIDLIHAKTENNLQTAVGQLEGKLTKAIKELRQGLLDMIAGIEASIDYPEYDVEEESRSDLLQKAEAIYSSMESLLANADRGKILREGLQTVILGKPNVGKSSLLNWFLDEERAIVTEIAGTTRDTVEEYFNLDGIPIKIIDTAGIRETSDKVELIGVKKSKEFAARGDLLLIVLDSASPLTEEDFDVLKLAEGKKALILLNKSDLPKQADEKALHISLEQTISISIKQNLGFDLLATKIKELFFNGEVSNDMGILGNTRHKTALFHAKESMGHAISAIKESLAEDFISMDLQQANHFLGEISGDTIDEEIIDRIFTRFCLGK